MAGSANGGAGKRKAGTKTSAFGIAGRFSHDSTRFYGSKMYAGVGTSPVEYVENPVPEEVLDSILCKSSEAMAELPDHSVHLMVTSPPYNVGKEYDNDLTLDDYLGLLRSVFRETHRVLVPGGRACINVANLGRKPYIPLHSYIIKEMAQIGFLMRGELIWDKGAGASPSTAWGTWLSPQNPTLRDVHEYILVFSKDSYTRPKVEGRQSSLLSAQFLEYTKSVWRFRPERARTVGHPAPFPIELPRRLIDLYTYTEEVVLDPFAGSGATCVAAVQQDRHYVGYDVVPEYCEIAQRRIGSAHTSPPLLANKP